MTKVMLIGGLAVKDGKEQEHAIDLVSFLFVVGILKHRHLPGSDSQTSGVCFCTAEARSL